MSGVRVDRLREARDWALANPEEFDMDSYATVQVNLESHTMCGSTRCIAGYGASQLHPVLWRQAAKRAAQFAIACGEGEAGLPLLGTKNKAIHDAGAEWFGLSEGQAEDLFLATEWQWLDVINRLIEENS